MNMREQIREAILNDCDIFNYKKELMPHVDILLDNTTLEDSTLEDSPNWDRKSLETIILFGQNVLFSSKADYYVQAVMTVLSGKTITSITPEFKHLLETNALDTATHYDLTLEIIQDINVATKK